MEETVTGTAWGGGPRQRGQGCSCFQLHKYHHLQTLATKGALVLPSTGHKLLASHWQE